MQSILDYATSDAAESESNKPLGEIAIYLFWKYDLQLPISEYSTEARRNSYQSTTQPHPKVLRETPGCHGPGANREFGEFPIFDHYPVIETSSTKAYGPRYHEGPAIVIGVI